MAQTFDVEVVAADHKLYTGPAISVVLPGADGYFGILRGHAPLVSSLTTGEVRITIAENQPPLLIAVSGGFVEVLPDKIVILADSAELASEIDIERARMAKERAEELLREKTSDIDFDRAQTALLRAINRMRVAERKI